MAQYELNVLDYWLIVKKRKYTIAATAALVIASTFTLTQVLRPAGRRALLLASSILLAALGVYQIAVSFVRAVQP